MSTIPELCDQLQSLVDGMRCMRLAEEAKKAKHDWAGLNTQYLDLLCTPGCEDPSDPVEVLPLVIEEPEDPEEYDDDFNSDSDTEIPEEIEDYGALGPIAWVPHKFSENQAMSSDSLTSPTECEQIVTGLSTKLVIFLRLLFSNCDDDANHLPESWKFFLEIAMLQVEVFGNYIAGDTYNRRQELLWMLSNNMKFQKEFLQRCIRESIEYEFIISDIAPTLESMLSLQDTFILKLIERLKTSKAEQTSQHTIFVQC